ncbi:MAG: gamma carbonic anhydrase family protein [Epsilonproteobacteria bacterium 4484_20]|nr:MAG: gamma carbonic anhydrase family protein [Epsilonproteobacteria bacterium 4484_20]
MLLKFKEWTPKLGKNAWVAEGASVIGRTTMGEDSAIWFGCVVRGDVHFITIGDRTNIQDLSMIHVTHHKKADMSDGNPTHIGNDVTVGHRVMLHGCTIEDACLIGMSATIGAGSLVTKNKKFPPRSLIMGSPAKVVRELTDEEVAELYASAERYVKFKDEYL